MAWRRPGHKPLYEPMMVKLLTHICVTRPQWVKTFNENTIWLLEYNKVASFTDNCAYLFVVKYNYTIRHVALLPVPKRLHSRYTNTTGPVFTKSCDVLSANLMKHRSHKISCYNYDVALKFDRFPSDLLLRCLSNIRAIGKSKPFISCLRSFTISCGNTSIRFIYNTHILWMYYRVWVYSQLSRFE